MKTFWKVTRYARAARFWIFVALAIAAWLGFGGNAHAAICGFPTKADVSAASGAGLSYAYESEARAACETAERWISSSGNPYRLLTITQGCRVYAPGGRFRIDGTYVGSTRYDYPSCTTNTPVGGGVDSMTGWTFVNPGCPPPGVYDPLTGQCSEPPACSIDDPPHPPARISSETSDTALACTDECEYVDPDTETVCRGPIDGLFYCSVEGWLPTGNACTAGPDTPATGAVPPPDSDEDGTSDPNDDSANNPGEGGQGDDGESDQDGSESCGGDGEPACTGSNDGSGDGNTSGGGGNCSTPPSSSGDAILAQIAFQTWATRCSIEAGFSSGENGDGDEEGDGDEAGPPGGDLGDIYYGSDDTITSVTTEHIDRMSNSPIIGFASNFLDADGISGACPVFNLSMFGRSIVIDFFCHPDFAQVVYWLGWFILAIFAWAAFKIGFL